LLSRQTSAESPSDPCAEHNLVVRRVRRLAELRDDGAGLLEFDLGQLHLAREVVQVSNRRAHDFAEARIARVAQLGEHRLGDLLLVIDDHFGG
jgi:hypothetical protein